MPSAGRAVAVVLGAPFLGLLLLLQPAGAADSLGVDRLGGPLSSEVLRAGDASALFGDLAKRRAGAEGGGQWTWDDLFGQRRRREGQGEQSISTRQLQSTDPVTARIEADLANIINNERNGVRCAQSIGGVPRAISRNITRQMDRVKIAIRKWPWHRRTAVFLTLWLEEFYKIPVRLVELDTNGTAVQEELLNGTIDLDFESWVRETELPTLGAGLTDFGATGYAGWPGIYASPALVSDLTAATPGMAVPAGAEPWFTSYRALATDELLNLLPMNYDVPMCAQFRCFYPTRCRGSNSSGCRCLQHRSPMAGGEHYAQQLIESHNLPLIIVYIDQAMWDYFQRNWPQMPPLLVASTNPPSLHPTPHRFLFPYSNMEQHAFYNQPLQDWGMVRVRKLGRRDLEMRMPDLVRWYFAYDAAMSYSIHSTAELYETLAPDNSTADERYRAVACYVNMGSFISLRSACFDADGNFICVRKATITCDPGMYPREDQRSSRWQCTTCPEGTYCPAGTQNPIPCSNGTTSLQGSISANDCVCMPGLGITWTVDSQSSVSVGACLPCAEGRFKVYMGNRSCNGRCPSYSSSQMGSTSVAFCACAPGFFLERVEPHRCARCPKGAVCEGGLAYNITDDRSPNSSLVIDAWRNHSVPFSKPGFFAYSLEIPTSINATYTPYFQACPVTGTCLGENQCNEHTMGSSCRVCRKGYRRDLKSANCLKCANQGRTVLWLLGRSLIEPIGQLVLVHVIRVANKDSAVLTPIIIKIVGLWFLATRTCIQASIPQDGLRSPGKDVIRVLADFLMNVIFIVSSIFEIDLSFMSWVQCAIYETSDVSLSEAELEHRQFLNYCVRMVEVLLMPLIWPIAALVVILPIGVCFHRGDKRYLRDKLGAIMRMQILAAKDEDGSLQFSQVVIEDARDKLVTKNSLAGIWRPYTFEWLAHADVEENAPPVKTGCRLYMQSFIHNVVSMFMPFWFFAYLSLAGNCMKAVFSCNRFEGQAGQVEWWHGFEPTIACFSPQHYTMVIMGMFGLVFYGVGIPLLVCFVVHRKMRLEEEWCFGFNVNGYRFWGWITVYWDAILLSRSFFLSFVDALPQETFQLQKELIAIIICASGMVLQSAVQPFDARRHNALNKLEAMSLATATLVSPILIIAVQFEQQQHEVGVQLCLLAFSLLVLRFMFRVLSEGIRDIRDAVIQFGRQAAFASTLVSTKKRRQAKRDRQQKQWLGDMLAGPAAEKKLRIQRGVQRLKTNTIVHEHDKPVDRLRRFVSRGAFHGHGWCTSWRTWFSRMREWFHEEVSAVRAVAEETDAEDEDAWSDFSEDGGEDESVSKRSSFGVLTFLRCIRMLLKDLWVYLFGGISWLKNVWSRVKRAVKAVYHVFRWREERQNRFGLVFDQDNQSFKFQSTSRTSSDVWQREQVVGCFSNYMSCLLQLHFVERFPINLPRSLLSEAFNEAASDRRSLRWKALTRKADRHLQATIKTYITSKLDHELLVSSHALESKLYQWLNIDNPSGQLVRVQSLETYLLRSQFVPRHIVVQSLAYASITESKPTKADKIVDMDQAINCTANQFMRASHVMGHVGSHRSVGGSRSGSRSIHAMGSKMSSKLTEQSMEDMVAEVGPLGPDMVLGADLPTHPLLSHVAEYWTAAHSIQLADPCGSSFWDPLWDPHHPRVRFLQGEEELPDDYHKTHLPATDHCESTLTLAVRQAKAETKRLQLEKEGYAPWPLYTTDEVNSLIMGTDFLDLRTKHALSRLHAELGLGVLGDLGRQHDIVRSLRGGFAEKVQGLIKEVEHCKDQAARYSAHRKGFTANAAEVLHDSEHLVISVGLTRGYKIFEELSQRLGGGGLWGTSSASWQRSHGQWFEAACKDRMREFTCRWTRWGVPVMSASEAKVMKTFEFSGNTRRRLDMLEIPVLHDTHAWPMWQAMVRRNTLMYRDQSGDEVLTAIAADLPASIANTPAGQMLTVQDWDELTPYLKGDIGKAFARQLWLILEERRQIMLDWAYSIATGVVREAPAQATTRGHPVKVELEKYDPGPPIVDDFAFGSIDKRIDLDRCRRAFGLSAASEIVWCTHGLHDLSLAHDGIVPRHCSCDICEAVLGRARTGGVYCCMLCNNVFCEGCVHLAKFLTSGLEETNLRPAEDDNLAEDQARDALDILEAQNPGQLLDELNRLPGQLSCEVVINGVQMEGRDIFMWARQRVLSGLSILSMFICKEGRHTLGNPSSLPKRINHCVTCGTKVVKREGFFHVCGSCDAFFCSRCATRTNHADILRSEISHCWNEGVLNDSTREMLCMRLKVAPMEVLDIMYRVLDMRASDARGSVRDLSLLVHRSITAATTTTVRPSSQPLILAELTDGSEGAALVERKSGPDGPKDLVRSNSEAVQVNLTLLTGPEGAIKEASSSKELSNLQKSVALGLNQLKDAAMGQW